jgi:hypothetical protein
MPRGQERVGHRTESIYRRRDAIVDDVMLCEDPAKLAAYSDDE